MTGLLVVLAALQAPPTLDASVDPNRVTVGDEVVYVLRATSRSPDPISVSVAPFTGFQIISRLERTELSGGTARTSVWEIHLRAAQAGRWQLGPAHAQQGSYSVQASALAVQVDAGRTPVVTVLSPRVRRLLERTPYPPRGRAAISLLTSDDTVRVGEQVDIVTAAWFPRELREELLRPPILQPPVVDGVWTYPQTAPVEIVATRIIDGVTYDLFAAPQVIFPLAAASVTIPPATLKYGVPAALPPFNREDRVSLASQSAALTVLPLPVADRPADFSGAVGSRLRIDRRVESTTMRVGETVAVEYTLSGDGNTALWPAPDIRWPTSARAYSERVEEKVASTDGRLGGGKTFRFLVVPDSVGLLTLPGVRYRYFDLAAGRYVEATIAAATISVGSSGEEATAGALPPSLLSADGPTWSWRLGHDVPDWAWLLLLLLPPFAVALYARFPRRDRVEAAPAASDTLAAAEERLDAALRVLVPDPTHRSDRELGVGLRAMGVDAETVDATVAVRARIMATRYGPRGGASDAALAASVDSVTQRLVQAGRLGRRRTTVALLWVGLVCAGSLGLLAIPLRCVAAQVPAPDELYRTGALHAAVEGFQRQVEAAPAVAAHWYGLGASYYRLGLKGRAAAAWLHARRLDPREPAIRRALQLTPPPDPISARQVWVPPVRPDELLIFGLCGWIIAWLGWAGRPRARDRWAILLVFSGLAMAAGIGLRQWYRRPVALVAGDAVALRLSPHGRAPEIAKLEPGSAVIELRTRADWVFVRAPDGREGWLPVAAVASLGG